MSQFQSQFLDFDKSSFEKCSKEIYEEVYRAQKKGDKTQLLRYLTMPNYDVIKICAKINQPAPFVIYPFVKSSKIVQAHITSENYESSIDLHKFAHITVKMILNDAKGDEATQFNVFERRLDQTQKES